jgi:simple sugar transport system ATP-binding protein
MSLELREIRKHFGEVRANDGVDLTVEAGTIHGLLGENGAGKSTLMKILSGFLQRDAGEVVLDGRALALAEPQEALEAGIGMLHQDPLVFLPFSVLDNFLLGSPGGSRLERTEGAKALETLAGRFGFRFDVDALVRTLTVGERQQLEICRLLWLGAKVLILDEPTTGISAAQRGKLFATLRTLASEGMTVIFVSHKLEEIEQLCGRATVMRQGKVVGDVGLPCPPARLVEMMFGRVIADRKRQAIRLGSEVLRLEAVTVRDRNLELSDLSLTVRAAEVIGLAGLEGSGQRTLLRTCAGLLSPDSGRVWLGDKDLTGQGYRPFLHAGVHYLPAGRLEEGLMAGLTISEHFEVIREEGPFVIDWGQAEERASARIQTHSIKGLPNTLVEALSGGNQQRLLLAMVPDGVRLLLMEHPTRGLDIESADWVWSQILERRRHGTGIVFASADLDELIRYSDRIMVFFSGDVLATVDAASTDADELGHLIGGKVRA